MSGGTYSAKTLNDNWAEERLVGEKSDKGSWLRPDENDLPVTRMARKVQSPSYAIPDDGFPRYEVSKTHEEFPHPKSRKEVVTNPPALKTEFINTETIPEVCAHGRRPMNDVPAAGFRAVLARHDKTEGERSWDTSMRLGYPVTAEQTQEFSDRHAAIHKKDAGVPSCRDPPMKFGGLVGENETLCNIPVQRAWMANEDPGLREFLKRGRAPVRIPEVDNELSLPLGDGCQKEIVESLKARGGKLYRTKTSITTGKGHKSEIAVWQDYP